jgi:hypothetical protein
MTIGCVVVSGLLAMAPNWAIVDLPYPESTGTPDAHHAVTPEGQVTEAIFQYARTKGAAPLRRSDIAELKVEGPKATARVTLAHHTETVHLEFLNHEWKVVRIE